MASATTIAERYEIEGRLGVGGMSTVHLAFDHRLGRNVPLHLLAAHLADDQSSITQVGSVLGTAAYLAPEQARGEEAGPQADIYSLGVVTYQLMSGRLPYEASSLSELALMQQRESPVPLNQLNDRVTPELARA